MLFVHDCLNMLFVHDCLNMLFVHDCLCFYSNVQFEASALSAGGEFVKGVYSKVHRFKL